MTQPNTHIEALRGKLEAAKAKHVLLEASMHDANRKYYEMCQQARDAKHPNPSEYAAEWLKLTVDFRKQASKAQAAVTRAASALAIAETGVDPRDATRPKHYKAVLADGTVVATRKSPRTYTHAIVVPDKDGNGWWCEGWAGSESLAADRVRRLIGWGNKAQAVPAIIVK
jgi:hypothetical protein